MGKRRDARLAKLVAEEVGKASALGGTPMAGTTATVIPGDQLAALSQSRMPVMAQALQRDAATFGSQMGPNYPLIPYALDPLGPNGRPDPRKYQYDISENLQVSKQLAKWNTLKAAAEQCDVVSRSITIRATEVAKMDKAWIVSDDAIAAVMDRDGVGTAQASATARQENATLIAKLNEFWDNPYPQSDRGWREWITEAMWQVLVYDGLAIHPQMSLGRDVLGFNIIDSSTIKLLLNNYGDTPRPPDPAFQQILWGFPRGEFTASPDKDPKNPTKKFVDGAYRNGMRDQLSYYVMNRRTWTPYGFSPVEQAIPLANLYMEYQQMMLFEFKHGTSSDVYMKTTGDEITLQSVTNWERIYNDWAEGSTANRRKTRVLPPGFDPVFGKSVDEAYKPDYIESILKRLAAIFGISSQQLGVIPRAGMGGGKGAQEGDQDNAETVSSKPMMNFIEEFVNSLSRRYLGATKAVTFTLQDDKGGQDDVEIANAAKIKVSSAIMTANEQRREMGLPDYDFAGADEPFIVAGNQVIYLRGQFNASQAPQSPQGPQGAQPEVQESPDSGEAPATDVAPDAEPDTTALKFAEAKAYRSFVAKGRARPFEFKYHTEDEAETLKAGLVPNPKLTKRSSEGTPQYRKMQMVAHKHAVLLAAALAAGVKGITEAVAGRSGAGVIVDTTAAASVLKDLYTAAGAIGGEYGSIATGTEAIDSQSVASLLANRGFTLRGVTATIQNHIGTAIEDGIAAGDSQSAIADSIRSQVLGPMLNRQASTIAITETNRAYNAAFADNLQSAGFQGWEWLTDGDPCPECVDNEGTHSFGDTQPPEHPNCQCIMTPGDFTATS